MWYIAVKFTSPAKHDDTLLFFAVLFEFFIRGMQMWMKQMLSPQKTEFKVTLILDQKIKGYNFSQFEGKRKVVESPNGDTKYKLTRRRQLCNVTNNDSNLFSFWGYFHSTQTDRSQLLQSVSAGGFFPLWRSIFWATVTPRRPWRIQLSFFFPFCFAKNFRTHLYVTQRCTN